MRSSGGTTLLRATWAQRRWDGSAAPDTPGAAGNEDTKAHSPAGLARGRHRVCPPRRETIAPPEARDGRKRLFDHGLGRRLALVVRCRGRGGTDGAAIRCRR